MQTISQLNFDLRLIGFTLNKKWFFLPSLLPKTKNICQTQIVHKVRLHVRQIVLKQIIYFQVQNIHTPFVKPDDIPNLAVPNIFYIQSYMKSTFTYNLG